MDNYECQLRNIFEEISVLYLRYYPEICLDRLRKTTNNISKDNQWPSQDPNSCPPKYEAVVLTTQQHPHQLQ